MKHRSTQFYTILAIVVGIVLYTLTHKEASDVPKWMLTDWVKTDTLIDYDGNTEMKDTAKYFSHFRITFQNNGYETAKELVTIYLDPIIEHSEIKKKDLK